MKKISFTFLAILLALNINAKQSEVVTLSEVEKPNIIVLFADDISAREIPIYGSSQWSYPPQGGNSSDPKYRAKTPVLDELAKEGVWIKTAWASTVCMPSRAMMMTGRYAHLHKWWNNKMKGTIERENGKKSTCEIYESSPHTNAFVAKAGGYATFWAGKTQMGGVNQFGFDEACFTPGVHEEKNTYTDFKIIQKKIDGKRVLINEDTGGEVQYYQQFGWYWQPHVELMNHPDSDSEFEIWPNTPESKASYGLHTYGPDIELNFTLDFMERTHEKGKPFFIYHTTHLGHDGWDFLNPDINPETRQKWPGTPKIEWKDGKYTRTEPKITGDKGNYNTHGTVTEGGIHTHINYIDYQIWQYMQKLKELGEENNTVFIFAADNGTSKYGKNSPISQKGCHIPLIIYAPCLKMTKQGEQNVLANLADIVPTIADIAGVEFPESYEINGESLIPFLTTKKPEHREWIYSYHKHMQLIRGKNVLIDGKGTMYDVSKYPDDLISFPVIKDMSTMSKAYQKEEDALRAILPKFSVENNGRNAPKGGYGDVEALKAK
ncbi:sulfatase-like hydrolase/transferase [Bacteroidales bacterium]|nr:sulfatase-like hydrolase/transferase [Bacteroidales bacterium]